MSEYTYTRNGNTYTQDQPNNVKTFIKDNLYTFLFVAAAITMLISIADWSKL